MSDLTINTPAPKFLGKNFDPEFHLKKAAMATDMVKSIQSKLNSANSRILELEAMLRTQTIIAESLAKSLSSTPTRTPYQTRGKPHFKSEPRRSEEETSTRAPYQKRGKPHFKGEPRRSEADSTKAPYQKRDKSHFETEEASITKSWAELSLEDDNTQCESTY
jgi:hypothetical protein